MNVFPEPEVIPVNDMFIRQDYPTIMDGLVIRYRLRSPAFDGEISASRNGICISGSWPTMDATAAPLIVEVLLRADLQAKHLRNVAGAQRRVQPLDEQAIEVSLECSFVVEEENQ